MQKRRLGCGGTAGADGDTTPGQSGKQKEILSYLKISDIPCEEVGVIMTIDATTVQMIIQGI